MSRPARDVLAALAAVFSILATGAPANAAKKFVSALGSDSMTCGAVTSPCRSITQAITNAAIGDTIVVGPGLYGDLDHDNVLGEPGEEPGGCGGTCLLEINKSVTILSTDGPGATIIHAPEALAFNAAVSITALNVTLGKPGKGFRIYGGLLDQVSGSGVDGTKLMGNRLIARSTSSGAILIGNDIIIRGNAVLGPAAGDYCIAVSGDNAQIIGNLVSGCTDGFEVIANNWTMVGNVATNNETGLYTYVSDGLFGPPVKFLNNAFIGNFGSGIWLATADNPLAGTTVDIGSSNIFGNGAVSGNCGLRVENTDFYGDPVTINADKVFWGAVSGPGSDPADAFCLDVGTATLNATNPKLKAYAIKGPVLR